MSPQTFALALTVLKITQFNLFTFKKQVKVIECNFRNDIVRWEISKFKNVSYKLLRYYRFREIKILICLPSKSRSRSRSAIFAITPFDGQCQMSFCVKSCCQVSKIKKKNRFEQFQSNGASSVFLFMTLTFIFKVKVLAFSCFANISQKVGNTANITLASDRKSGILYRMTSLRMLYVMTSTYIFKFINFLM